MVCVATGVNDALGKTPPEQRHPGLQLDRFSETGDQKTQRRSLEEVVKARGDVGLLSALRTRRSAELQQLDATSWTATTSGPLTLHLSRASSLENAGICLHPVYGFVYLPGSGLKGMAHAYAHSTWLPAQADKTAAWRVIEDVFGWAPNKDRAAELKMHPEFRRKGGTGDHVEDVSACVGSVVFHDSWPRNWPRLHIDIANNHHQKYYEKGDPPGDWEEPNPIYFLSVGPGVEFDFALSARRGDVRRELLDHAREWLCGALTYLGAGAKTSAGYGGFAIDSARLPERSPLIEETIQVRLASPGFLAGALQQTDDCNLRSASLRGQLRWWWRTLHAAWVGPKELHDLEAAVWGSTATGGSARVEVMSDQSALAQPYDKRSKADWAAHKKASPMGIDGCDPRKTTQGSWYVTYGMDEAKGQRNYSQPGTEWPIRIVAKPTSLNGKVITASQVKGQVRAALWLLCQFGGVGSKSRKGLGSLQLVHDSTLSLDGCKSIGKEFRDGCGVKSRLNERPETPALECMLDPVQVVTPWNDVWFALDQVGFSAQAYAKKFKHDRTKCALGLPRRIGAPVKGEFRSNLSRHTSPVHLHLARQEPSGQIVIRAVGFPAARLPDFATSRAFLDGYFRHLKDDLANRAKINAQPRDAPRAEPPKPKPHVEVKRGTEDWPKCHITWKPGSGELVVRSNTGKTTAISGEPAKTVLESLSQELRDRLKRNKELKGVDVHVSFEGSHYKLVRLG